MSGVIKAVDREANVHRQQNWDGFGVRNSVLPEKKQCCSEVGWDCLSTCGKLRGNN
jgi:hypothetical protein